MLQHGREPEPPVRPTPMTMDNRRRNLGFFFDQSVARLPDKVAITTCSAERSVARPIGSSTSG